MTRMTLTLSIFLTLVLSVSAFAAGSVVDGKPSMKAGQDAGVFVWREADGNWRVQVNSGGDTRMASGGFSTSQPFNWISSIATEPGDTVTRRTPNAVDFEFRTSRSDYVDGMILSAAPEARLCLWTWGSFGNEVYLGASATPIATPVDLTSNGACGGNANRPPASPARAGGRTHNPGHYIAMNDWEGQAAMVEAVSKPGVKGVLVRYLWRDLEPSYGQYDFSRIESDLRLMADHGAQLIVRVEDKSFEPHIRPTPRYLWENHTVWHGNWRGGFVAKRWLPWVTERMGELTKAMGERFDAHPNFEGITFEESATSFTAGMQRDYQYSPARYRDETIKMLRNTREHFPRSQVFWSMNFLEGGQHHLAEIAEAVAPLDIAMGGPDVLPDDGALKRLTYPLYEQFRNDMTLFGSVQYVGYNHVRADGRTKYWTPAALFWYAREVLHVDYVFWTQKRTADPADSYTWLDALPVIRNNPTW